MPRSGEIAIPLFLMASGVVLLMNNFNVVTLQKMGDLWPLLLISAVIENLMPRAWKS